MGREMGSSAFASYSNSTNNIIRCNRIVKRNWAIRIFAVRPSVYLRLISGLLFASNPSQLKPRAPHIVPVFAGAFTLVFLVRRPGNSVAHASLPAKSRRLTRIAVRGSRKKSSASSPDKAPAPPLRRAVQPCLRQTYFPFPAQCTDVDDVSLAPPADHRRH